MRTKDTLKLLAEGKITLSKAAKMCRIDVWTLSLKIKKAKIQWVKDKVIKEDIGEF